MKLKSHVLWHFVYSCLLVSNKCAIFAGDFAKKKKYYR